MTENSIVRKTEKAKSKKKIILLILLLGALIGLAIDLWIYFRGQDTPTDNSSSNNSTNSRKIENSRETEASR